MLLVGTALNLGQKMKKKKNLQLLTSFTKPQLWLFHVAVLQTTTKKWTKVKNVRAGRVKLFFCLLNMQMCDVLVSLFNRPFSLVHFVFPKQII